jgi:hypothetical protein
MRTSKIIAAMALAFASHGVHASIVGGANFINLTGGEPVSSPGAYQDNFNAFGWDEVTGVTLGGLVGYVDYNISVASDTLVDSHFIGFDPLAHTSVSASITFSTAILGVIYTDYSLYVTDGALGLPTVAYFNPAHLGLEMIDTFSVSGNTITFFDAHARVPGDFMRVITAAVPEPSTYAMMGLGLAGVMFATRRQRRAV